MNKAKLIEEMVNGLKLVETIGIRYGSSWSVECEGKIVGVNGKSANAALTQFAKDSVKVTCLPEYYSGCLRSNTYYIKREVTPEA